MQFVLLQYQLTALAWNQSRSVSGVCLYLFTTMLEMGDFVLVPGFLAAFSFVAGITAGRQDGGRWKCSALVLARPEEVCDLGQQQDWLSWWKLSGCRLKLACNGRRPAFLLA